MKIEIRIPTEAYAYYSVWFDSIEEYKEKYPEFIKTMAEVRGNIKKDLMSPEDKFNQDLKDNPQ